MKLIWKITAAAVIGWTGSVACDKFQEWGTPAQYWQDLWYGKAESEIPDQLKAQVEARKQQAVERDIKGKALRVASYLAEPKIQRFTTMWQYTRRTPHGILTIRHFIGKDHELLVFWNEAGTVEVLLVFGWSQGKGQKPLITAYQPGDWEKVLDEIQPEAIAAEKAALERRKPTVEDFAKKNWGLE